MGTWDSENNNGQLVRSITATNAANAVTINGGNTGSATPAITMGGNTASVAPAITIGGSIGSFGGNETRPRNVNVLYCIRY